MTEHKHHHEHEQHEMQGDSCNSCECGHCQGHPVNEGKGRLVRATVSLALMILGIVLGDTSIFSLPILLAAYFVTGYDILWRAISRIPTGKFLDESFLMTIATVGAFAVGQYSEAVAVMIFYQLGESMQDRAVGRSRASISALMAIRPDTAHVLSGDAVQDKAPQEVAVGEIVVLRPGDRIPLDGKVIMGESFVDTSSITGESVPRKQTVGDELMAGCIVTDGVMHLQVSKPYGDSAVERILRLVEEASARKAPAEKLITKFAAVYTPIVVALAALVCLVPPLILGWDTFPVWLYRGLLFLVVSCPCAVVISIPLSFFAGIGKAASLGILIKGGNYLEALRKIDTAVFDKTGTLTKGSFTVTQVTPQGISDQELLRTAAQAERYSNHPIAKSILTAYPLSEEIKGEYSEIAGRGIRAVIDGHEILCGNDRLMTDKGIAYQQNDAQGTVLYVARDGVFLGSILISDTLKQGTDTLVEDLKKQGIHRTYLLTGDRKSTGEAVARQLGMDGAYCELLPEHKVEKLEEIASTGSGVLFMGDGINDAPVLARADVGVAMGGIGSDAAMEAADIVLMQDNPDIITEAVAISRKTHGIVRQNIVFALAVKVLVMTLGVVGLGTMWMAIFADVGVALLDILNSLRIRGSVRNRKN